MEQWPLIPACWWLYLFFFASKKQNKTTSASHFDLAIYSKEYLKAKEEELGKLKYFPHANNIIFKKSSKKKPKSFKILFITLLQLISSFNTSQNYHLSKILI